MINAVVFLVRMFCIVTVPAVESPNKAMLEKRK